MVVHVVRPNSSLIVSVMWVAADYTDGREYKPKSIKSQGRQVNWIIINKMQHRQ